MGDQQGLDRSASPSKDSKQEPAKQPEKLFSEQPESYSQISASTSQLLLSRSASHVSRTFVNASQLSSTDQLAPSSHTPTGSRQPSPGRVIPAMQGVGISPA